MLLTNEQRAQFAEQISYSDGWVIMKNISSKDIEVCEGEATADSTARTCELRVAANRTAYRPNNVWPLTHPNCKCNGETGKVSVQEDFPMRKLTNYLFTDHGKIKVASPLMKNKKNSDRCIT